MARIYIPNFFEYIFDFIERKGIRFLFDRLTRPDFLKVKDVSRIRQFAEKSTIDEKMILCSKIGMGCAIVFWDKEKEKTKLVQDVLIAYMDVAEHDLPKQIAKDRVYVSVDIDFIKALQTVSKASHSNAYAVNRKYLEIKKNSESFNTRSLVKKLEADRNLEWYSKTIQYAFDLPEILEVFKISLVQFRILLYLHTLPNGATKDNIARKMGINIVKTITPMYEMNMIAFGRDGEVTIDVYGIMVLEQIFCKFP